MGRTKGKHIHVLVDALIARGGFGEDLEHNKTDLRKLGLLSQSKTEFNKLAGELTTAVKNKAKKSKERESRRLPVSPAVPVSHAG